MSNVDSLGAAMKSNIIPNKEYLLQGSIMNKYVDVLLERLRGLCDNVDSGFEQFHDQEMCFSIRDKARPTIVRSSVDVAVTPTIVEYLTELGARLEFEYAARGYMFRKGRMKITVFKINPASYDSINNKPEEFVSQSYLVEMSVLAPTGQEAIGEEMKAFAEQLKPLVHLDKIDIKRSVHPMS
ncbi:hypothetical protein V9T40_000433 [Parthenolecanium corni]|uniref:Mediator of RNA polymerase II transcription subunit 18 n=1 Tax=Parthenolecanium corni TaxID=536013 RepID=A0AAN9TCV8_9HEMI